MRTPHVVVVMGVAGTGKTTIGPLLAAAAGRPVRRGRRLPPAGQHRQDVGRAPRSTTTTGGPGSTPSARWAHERAGLGGVVSCSALKRAVPRPAAGRGPGRRLRAPDRRPGADRGPDGAPARALHADRAAGLAVRHAPAARQADEAGVAVDVSGSPRGDRRTGRGRARRRSPTRPRVTAPHPPTSPITEGNHRDQSQCRDAGSGRRRADHLGRPRAAGHRRPGGHRRHRPAHHQVQAARLPGADHRLARARRVRRGAAGQGHHQLHRRARLHRRGRRRADRARRDPRQAARRLRAAPTRSSTRSSPRRAGAPCPGRWC